MMFLLSVLVFALIFYFLKGNGVEFFKPNTNNPEELLYERFVKGEIDESTYEKMILTLKE